MVLSGYSACTVIPIASSPDGELTNYQIKLTLVKGEGDNTADTKYLDNESDNWPYDIRFSTDSEGASLIHFWREEYDETDGTWWVKVPSVPASGGTTIYLHVGKADADDLSDVYNTFIAPSDDFRYPAWTTKSDMPWSAADVTAASYNGKIYIIGGYNSCATDELDTVYEYNPATGTYTAKTAMPTARWGMVAVQVGGKIYVFGGMADSVGQNVLEIYDISGNSWSSGANLPAEIDDQGISGCTDGTDIYLQYGAYLYKYDVSEDTYAQLSAEMADPRTWAVTQYYGGKIYVVTGYKTTGTTGGCAKVNIWDVAGESWSTGTDAPYGLYGACREECVYGDKIFIICGQAGTSGALSGGFFNTVLEYDISGNAWTERSPGPIAVDGCAGALVSGAYYLFGGRCLVTGPVGTSGVASYDIDADCSTTQTRWTWTGLGERDCPDDYFRIKSLGTYVHAGIASKSTVDTDGTWIEMDVIPQAGSYQPIEILYSTTALSPIYWYVLFNVGEHKVKIYTRSGGSGAYRWTSTNSVVAGTKYHLKILDTGSAITLYWQTAAGVDIESRTQSYDSATSYLNLRAGTTGDDGRYINLIIRKYTANPPVISPGSWEASSDPEGSLIGGKLIRGGLLLHGVLGRA